MAHGLVLSEPWDRITTIHRSTRSRHGSGQRERRLGDSPRSLPYRLDLVRAESARVRGWDVPCATELAFRSGRCGADEDHLGLREMKVSLVVDVQLLSRLVTLFLHPYRGAARAGCRRHRDFGNSS